MKKFLILLFAIFLMIVVPILIVYLGVVLTQRNKISVDNRVIAPKEWSVEAIAKKYAPVFLQETDEKFPHWDYIAKINFDGDWDLLNNSANIQNEKYYKNIAGYVYFSLLESRSHFFITYTVFHPLDWGYKNGFVKKWYENDIKNVQVVIEKTEENEINGKVLFLMIQHGNNFDIYDVQKKSFAPKKSNKCIDNDVYLCNDNLQISKDGTHPILWIEKGRHNIYSINNADIKFIKKNNMYTIKGGITYTALPVEESKILKNYTLLNIANTIWERGAPNPDEINSIYTRDRFGYYDESFFIDNIPVYFKGKQLEGHGMNAENPSIAPFLLGKNADTVLQGTFFFNPIKAYSMLFELKDWWSLEYRYHPYVK